MIIIGCPQRRLNENFIAGHPQPGAQNTAKPVASSSRVFGSGVGNPTTVTTALSGRLIPSAVPKLKFRTPCRLVTPGPRKTTNASSSGGAKGTLEGTPAAGPAETVPINLVVL